MPGKDTKGKKLGHDKLSEEVDVTIDEPVVVEEPVIEDVGSVEEPVIEEPITVPDVGSEVVEPMDVGSVETFQAQLVQALELNDNLLHELEVKDKEITVFKQVKEGLEKVIEEQNNQLTQLKETIHYLETEKFREKISDLADKWIKKYGMGSDSKPQVIDMLTKFQSEEELHKIENLLGLSSGKEKPSPIALTETSNSLAEKFSDGGQIDYQSLGPQEKLDVLHKQLVAYEQLKK